MKTFRKASSVRPVTRHELVAWAVLNCDIGPTNACVYLESALLLTVFLLIVIYEQWLYDHLHHTMYFIGSLKYSPDDYTVPKSGPWSILYDFSSDNTVLHMVPIWETSFTTGHFWLLRPNIPNKAKEWSTGIFLLLPFSIYPARARARRACALRALGLLLTDGVGVPTMGWGIVHCCTPSLCILGAETGYRVGTPFSRT